MVISLTVALGVSGLSLVAWIWLILGRGFFWKMDQTIRIPRFCVSSSGDGDQFQANEGGGWPSVKIIIPARNEAETLPVTLPSLLNQDYPGSITVFLVDDNSTDGTAELAIRLGQEHGASQRLRVLPG